MAKGFNLTAQINLVGPGNLKPIVSEIRRELGSIQSNVVVKLDKSSGRSIDDVTRRLSSMNSILIQSKQHATDLNNIFRTLSGSFGNIQSSSQSSSRAIQQTGDKLKSVAKSAAVARTEMEEFGRQTFLAVKRFAAFSLPTTAIFSFVNAINSGLKAFIDFDKELVKLQQVTGKGSIGIASLEQEITTLATTLGVSSESLIKVASTLAQAGLSAEETRLSLAALAKTELAPSFDSLTETTEGAIAAMRQFNIGAKDLEAALGSINAVAAAFAVESADIITAIQRTGGVFATASKGVTEGKQALNEFIAVFTSVRATTRESAETIATGLRTIFTRIQRSSTIRQLKDFGVNLQDLEGKFVGPYEAVKRLSDALNKIDPRSGAFSTIVEELGGFRQIGKVIPLIQQFETTQQALGVAQKGSNSLTEAQVKAQQSLANQLAKVREQFLALVRDVGKSTVFQGFFTIVTKLASGLISLASAFKPILPLLAIFAAVKGVKAVSEIGSGFFGGLKKGGGAKAIGTTAGEALTGAKEKESSDVKAKATAAISENTSALKTLTTAVNSLTTAINSRRPSTLKDGGKILGFNKGGMVPGNGGGDTVPAFLEGGEIVMNRKAVKKYGAGNLLKMNKYPNGGSVKEAWDPEAKIKVSVGVVNRKRGAELPLIKDNLIQAAENIKENIKGNLKGRKITKISNLAGISGSLFETAVAALTSGSEWTSDVGTFDFPKGIGKASSIFGNPGLASVVTDAKRTASSAMKENIIKKISNFNDRRRRKFGVASLSGDTTPLTISGKEINKYNDLKYKNLGGQIQKFMAGSPGGINVPSGKGRGKKVKKGARGKFEHLNQSQIESLSTEEMIDYAKRQMYHIMTTGGSGISLGEEFVEVPESRIDQELEKDLVTLPDGRRGFYREKIAPFGAEKVAKSKKSEQQQRREKFFRTSRDLLTAAMQGIMAPGSALPKAQQDAISPFLEMVTGDYSLGLSATPRLKSDDAPVASASSTLLASIKDPLSEFRKSGGQTSLAGVIPASAAEKIKAAIPAYIESLKKENETQKVGKAQTALKYFDDFINGGTAAKPAHATHFAETVNQILKGGLVQGFAEGGSPTPQQLVGGPFPKGRISSQGETWSQILTKRAGELGLAIDSGSLVIGGRTISLSKALTPAQLRAGTVVGKAVGNNETTIKALASLRENIVKEYLSGRQEVDEADPFNLTEEEKRLARSIAVVGIASDYKAASRQVYKKVGGVPFSVSIGSLSGAKSEEVLAKLRTKDFANLQEAASELLPDRPLVNLTDQDLNRLGRPNAEGYQLEAILALLGATGGEYNERNRAVDFEGGLPPDLAALFGVPSGVFTQAKRTLNSDNVGHAIEGIAARLSGVRMAFGGQVRGLISNFASGGTIPAMVSNGEAFIPPSQAKKIGYAKLNRMNQADRNGMSGFAVGGGIFKGPGSGTSDSIGPIDLPVGGYVIRKKAVDALTSKFNSGGYVGDVETFATGGSVVTKNIARKQEIVTEQTKLKNLEEQKKTATGLEKNIIENEINRTKATIQKLQASIEGAIRGFDDATKRVEESDTALDSANQKLIESVKARYEATNKGKKWEDQNLSEQSKAINEARAGSVTVGGVDVFETENKAINEAKKRADKARRKKEKGYAGAKSAEQVREAGLTPQEIENRKQADQAMIEYRAKQQGLSSEGYKYKLAQQVGQKSYEVKEMYQGRAQEMSAGLVTKLDTFTSIGRTAAKAREIAGSKDPRVTADAKAAAETQLADANSRLAAETENIFQQLRSLNPTLDMDKVQKASEEVATLLSEGKLEEAQKKLIDALGGVPGKTEAMNIAMQQLARELNIDVKTLERTFGDVEGKKILKRQEFIQSREGQRFGAMAEFAPDFLQSFSKTRLGKNLGAGADFISGKGGRFSKLFAGAGGFQGIGSAVAVGSETLKQFLPAETLRNPNTAGAFGAVSGAGAGAAGGAQLGMMVAGPVGALIGGVGGAIIGGIKGFFDAKNTAVLKNSLDTLADSSGKVDAAFKKLETQFNEANLGAVQEAIGQEMISQSAIKDMALANPASILGSAASGSALTGAGIGAGIGTFFGGPVGMLVGAGAGYLAGTAYDYFSQPSEELRKEALSSYITQAGTSTKNLTRVSEAQLSVTSLGDLNKLRTELEAGTAESPILAQARIAARKKGLDEEAAVEQAAINARVQQLKEAGVSETKIQELLKNSTAELAKEGKELLRVEGLNITKQQQLARAMKEVAKATESIMEKLIRFEAVTQRFGDEINDILIEVEALSNPNELRKMQRSGTERILGNTMAYDTATVNQAIEDVVKQMGGGTEAVQLGQQVKASEFLSKTLPTMLRQPGAESDPEAIIDQVRNRLMDILGKNNSAINAITEELKSKLGKGGKDANFGLIAQDLEASGLGSFSKVAEKAKDILIQFTKKVNDAFDGLTSVQKQWTETMMTSIEYTTRAQQIGSQSQLDLRKTLGQNISLEDLNKPFEDQIKELTGQILDPEQISQKILETRNKIKTLQDERSQIATEKDPAIRKQKLQDYDNAIRTNQLSLIKLDKGFKLLTEDSTRAANALQKIQDYLGPAKALKAGLLDIMANPQKGMELAPELSALTQGLQALSEGKTDIFGNSMFLKMFLGGLERMKTFGVQDEYTSKIEGQALSAAMKAAGPEMEVLMKTPSEALQKFFGHDTMEKIVQFASKPQESILAKTFTQYADAQKRANELYASSIKVITESIKESGIKPMVDKLGVELPQIFEDAAAEAKQNIEKAQKVTEESAKESPPAAAQTRSRGGIIYASKGQYVNFEAKGEDTIPAMLADKEFVVNAKATEKNLGLLRAINSGAKVKGFSKGGLVSEGGQPTKPRTREDIQSQLDTEKQEEANIRANIDARTAAYNAEGSEERAADETRGRELIDATIDAGTRDFVAGTANLMDREGYVADYAASRARKRFEDERYMTTGRVDDAWDKLDDKQKQELIDREIPGVQSVVDEYKVKPWQNEGLSDKWKENLDAQIEHDSMMRHKREEYSTPDERKHLGQIRLNREQGFAVQANMGDASATTDRSLLNDLDLVENRPNDTNLGRMASNAINDTYREAGIPEEAIGYGPGGSWAYIDKNGVNWTERMAAEQAKPDFEARAQAHMARIEERERKLAEERLRAANVIWKTGSGPKTKPDPAASNPDMPPVADQTQTAEVKAKNEAESRKAEQEKRQTQQQQVPPSPKQKAKSDYKAAQEAKLQAYNQEMQRRREAAPGYAARAAREEASKISPEARREQNSRLSDLNKRWAAGVGGMSVITDADGKEYSTRSEKEQARKEAEARIAEGRTLAGSDGVGWRIDTNGKETLENPQRLNQLTTAEREALSAYQEQARAENLKTALEERERRREETRVAQEKAGSRQSQYGQVPTTVDRAAADLAKTRALRESIELREEMDRLAQEKNYDNAADMAGKQAAERSKVAASQQQKEQDRIKADQRLGIARGELNNLTQRLGREPTDQEIMDEFRIPEEQVKSFRDSVANVQENPGRARVRRLQALFAERLLSDPKYIKYQNLQSQGFQSFVNSKIEQLYGASLEDPGSDKTKYPYKDEADIDGLFPRVELDFYNRQDKFKDMERESKSKITKQVWDEYRAGKFDLEQGAGFAPDSMAAKAAKFAGGAGRYTQDLTRGTVGAGINVAAGTIGMGLSGLGLLGNDILKGAGKISEEQSNFNRELLFGFGNRSQQLFGVAGSDAFRLAEQTGRGLAGESLLRTESAGEAFDRKNREEATGTLNTPVGPIPLSALTAAAQFTRDMSQEFLVPTPGPKGPRTLLEAGADVAGSAATTTAKGVNTALEGIASGTSATANALRIPQISEGIVMGTHGAITRGIPKLAGSVKESIPQIASYLSENIPKFGKYALEGLSKFDTSIGISGYGLLGKLMENLSTGVSGARNAMGGGKRLFSSMLDAFSTSSNLPKGGGWTDMLGNIKGFPKQGLLDSVVSGGKNYISNIGSSLVAGAKNLFTKKDSMDEILRKMLNGGADGESLIAASFYSSDAQKEAMIQLAKNTSNPQKFLKDLAEKITSSNNPAENMFRLVGEEGIHWNDLYDRVYSAIKNNPKLAEAPPIKRLLENKNLLRNKYVDENIPVDEILDIITGVSEKTSGGLTTGLYQGNLNLGFVRQAGRSASEKLGTSVHELSHFVGYNTPGAGGLKSLGRYSLDKLKEILPENISKKLDSFLSSGRYDELVRATDTLYTGEFLGRATSNAAELFTMLNQVGSTMPELMKQYPEASKILSGLWKIHGYRNGGLTTNARGLRVHSGTDGLLVGVNPNEFIMNDRATKENLPLLHHLNNGGRIHGYDDGGQPTPYGALRRSGPNGSNTTPSQNSTAITLDTKGLDTFLTNFNSYIDKLTKINFPTIPDTITMNGNHVVDVRVSGAAAFESLGPKMQDMISKAIDEKMGEIWTQSNGQLGSRPGTPAKTVGGSKSTGAVMQ